MSGISDIRFRREPDFSLCFLPSIDTRLSRQSATQRGFSPESDHANTLISDFQPLEM